MEITKSKPAARSWVVILSCRASIGCLLMKSHCASFSDLTNRCTIAAATALLAPCPAVFLHFQYAILQAWHIPAFLSWHFAGLAHTCTWGCLDS